MTVRRVANDLYLADEIVVSGNYLRSANVELSTATAVSSYTPTSRALDVLRRIARALEPGPQNRSWSLTGPYGTGKSSFALFLRALLSGDDDPARQIALETLDRIDPELAGQIRAGCSGIGEPEAGFLLAVVTASREPVSLTLLRALRAGIEGRWSGRAPARVTRALSTATRSPNTQAITDLVKRVSEHGPMLILIDEFGKNLESFADRLEDNDLFILQSLAELAAAGATPILFVTLQHLAFDDYVHAASSLQRREWGKVQGRFEDVPFVETTEDAARLVAQVVDSTKAGPQFRKARAAWAEVAHRRLTELGLAPEVPGGVETLEACYPLHPLSLLTLPDLCAKFGQHGRTLFTFMAGSEPHALGDFLKTARWAPKHHLPLVGLEEIYDFFVNSVTSLIGASSGSSRWLEVESRIRETSGLPPASLELLKTVGLLNLVSQGGALRASPAMLAFALGDEEGEATQALLDELSASGLLTFREFAGEYRLWQGSDYDIQAKLTEARDRANGESVASQLSRLHGAAPIVAGRHSQAVGMLRYFATHFADDPAQLEDLSTIDPAADGVAVLYLGDPGHAATMKVRGARPVVLGTSARVLELNDVVRELAALEMLLEDAELLRDHVARREVTERAGEARRQLNVRLRMAFAVQADTVDWWLLRSVGEPQRLDSARLGRSMSRLLSYVCDRVYVRSPRVNNEMLGRRELTSQGAKARRQLLEAMINAAEQPQLGLKGYGPERAMYEAFLHHTGVHATRSRDHHWSFGAPSQGDALSHAWDRLNELIEGSSEEAITVGELFAGLQRPPYGVKDGPLPVLLAAVLISRKDEIAIYQDGTYLAALTDDAMERLVKTPERFALRWFGLTRDRHRVLATLASTLGTQSGRTFPRNTSLLEVASPILALIRRLPEATRYATDLSATATAVRDALYSARQPDDLIFDALPIACGVKSLRGVATPDEVRRYADRLHAALVELQDWYPSVLAGVATAIAHSLRLSPDTATLRLDLQALGRQLDGKVLDPRVRSFLLLAADETFDDDQWQEALAQSLSGRAPEAWRTPDRAQFNAGLKAVSESLTRIQELHFGSYDYAAAGFVAQRHTVTNSDGHEDHMIIAVSEDGLQQLRTRARETIASLDSSHDRKAFIAAYWAELLAIEAEPTTVHLHANSQTNRTRHATEKRGATA